MRKGDDADIPGSFAETKGHEHVRLYDKGGESWRVGADHLLGKGRLLSNRTRSWGEV